MAEKTRYSDDELEEFRQIILMKLDKARKDYEILKSSITHEESNDTMDTSPTFKVLEEGATTFQKRKQVVLLNDRRNLYSISRLH